MDDARQIDLLEGILRRTASLVESTPQADYDARTPLPDFDVRALLSHIGGWIQFFAASAQGQRFASDPTAYVAGEDVAADVTRSVDTIVDGWRRHGLDREVPSMGGDSSPARMVLGMTAMEYLAHGWDVAVATGQDPAFEPEAATMALEVARQFLKPEYRSPQSFADEVPVPDSAPPLDRYLGFTGRDPAWRP